MASAKAREQARDRPEWNPEPCCNGSSIKRRAWLPRNSESLGTIGLEAIITGTEVSDAAAFAAAAGTLTSTQAAAFTSALPDGRNIRSQGYGIQVFTQLPTRWVTATASAYRGADMRFMFGGQFTSVYNNTAAVGPSVGRISVPSIDGAGAARGLYPQLRRSD